MTAERWNRVEELFHSAVALSPPDRKKFLHDACNGDDDLRSQVESLHEGDANPRAILEEGPPLPLPTEFTPGSTLGPYRIPPGAHFFFSQYILSRSPEHYPDPLRFDVRHGRRLAEPQLVTPAPPSHATNHGPHYATTAHGPSSHGMRTATSRPPSRRSLATSSPDWSSRCRRGESGGAVASAGWKPES